MQYLRIGLPKRLYSCVYSWRLNFVLLSYIIFLSVINCVIVTSFCHLLYIVICYLSFADMNELFHVSETIFF